VVAVPDLLQCGSLAAAHPRPVAALRQFGVEEGCGGRGRARPDIAARMAGAVERPRLWRHGDCIELGERGPAVDHLYADGERGVAGEGDAGESANEEEERQGLEGAHTELTARCARSCRPAVNERRVLRRASRPEWRLLRGPASHPAPA